MTRAAAGPTAQATERALLGRLAADRRVLAG
jgi:hypothetical protein